MCNILEKKLNYLFFSNFSSFEIKPSQAFKLNTDLTQTHLNQYTFFLNKLMFSKI